MNFVGKIISLFLTRDGGAWWTAVYGVALNQTRLKRLSSSSSRLVIAFLSRSKCLLISWLRSPSAVILEPKKIKSVTVSIVSTSICHEVIGPEKEMATHSSILAWRIPWTEEPGRLHTVYGITRVRQLSN